MWFIINHPLSFCSLVRLIWRIILYFCNFDLIFSRFGRSYSLRFQTQAFRREIREVASRKKLFWGENKSSQFYLYNINSQQKLYRVTFHLEQVKTTLFIETQHFSMGILPRASTKAIVATKNYPTERNLDQNRTQGGPPSVELKVVSYNFDLILLGLAIIYTLRYLPRFQTQALRQSDRNSLG